MKRKVKIKLTPKYGTGGNVANAPWRPLLATISQPDVAVNSTLKAVPRHLANLEAEKGEIATVPGKGGIPNTFKIGGSRHTNGGTPLNLPKDSFIYSDTKDMRIKDPNILSQFGMGKGSYTPADIAKKYDINKFKKILLDPDTDNLQRKTAEGMIANYNLKLAKLALLQESMKGFPQGIPVVAMPYIEEMEIDPSQFAQMNPQDGQEQTVDDDGQMNFGGIIGKLKAMRSGGPQVDYFQDGGGDPYLKELAIANKEALRKRQLAQEEADLFEKKFYQNIDQGIANNKAAMKQWAAAQKLESAKRLLEMTANPNPLFGNVAQYFPEALTEYQKAKQHLKDLSISEQVSKAASSGAPRKVIVRNPTAGQMFNQTTKQVPVTDQMILESMAYGGTPNYQGGGSEKTQTIGNKIYHKLNGVGWVTDKTTGKVLSGTPPITKSGKQNTSTKSTTKSDYLTSNTGKDYNPYGVSQDLLDEFAIANTQFRTNKVKGSQIPLEGGTYGDKDISLDQFMINNPSWAKEFSEKYPGKTYDPKNSEHVKQFQEFYNKNTYDKIYNEALNRNLSEDQAKEKAEIFVKALGFDPSVKPGSGNPKGLDSKHGQYTGSRIELQFKPKEVTETPADTKKEDTPVVTQADHYQQAPYQGAGSPWWLQDVIKTAHAAGNLARIKKYQPWQATPDVQLPEVTFLDPSRELAANAEQSRIAADSLAQFTGPQAFNARFNQIQGQGLKNAADILSRYNNQNVQVSNQQAANNANTMNQATQQKAQLATSLWDKYQTVNQMFDNSKSQARDALVSQYVNAITNKNYTANLNKMNPQFAVNPAIGGEYYFHDPRAQKPDFTQNPDFLKIKKNLMDNDPTLKGDPNGRATQVALKIMGLQPEPEDPYTYPQNPMIPQPYGG